MPEVMDFIFRSRRVDIVDSLSRRMSHIQRIHIVDFVHMVYTDNFSLCLCPWVLPERTLGTVRQYPGRHRPYQLHAEYLSGLI